MKKKSCKTCKHCICYNNKYDILCKKEPGIEYKITDFGGCRHYELLTKNKIFILFQKWWESRIN